MKRVRADGGDGLCSAGNSFPDCGGLDAKIICPLSYK